jgi:HEAT repeat protein
LATKDQFDSTTPLAHVVAGVQKHDHWKRQAAADELRRRLEPPGTLSQAALLAALEADDTELRAAAAQVLGEMRDLTPIDNLIGMLGEENDQVRISIAWALAHAGERVPVDAVLPLLEDSMGSVRIAALAGMGNRAPVATLLAALRDPSVRDTAAHWLRMRGDGAHVGALAHLARDEDAGVRAAAITALGADGSSTYADLVVDALRDLDPGVRLKAIEEIAEWGERMPADRLLPLLDDPTTAVQFQAIKALARIGEPTAIARIVAEARVEGEFARENLYSGLRSGRNSDVAMRQISRHIPADVLLACLHDPWWPGGFMAAEFVGALGDAAPLDELLTLLRDAEPGTRWAAAHALTFIRDRVPIEPLLEALGDSDGNVRGEAAEALERFGADVPVERLLGALEGGADYVGSVNVQVAAALAKLGRQEGIEALVQVLCSDALGWNAARALGEIGSAAPIEPLIAAFGNSNTQVRIRAAESLHKTHPEALAAVVPMLLTTLKGDHPWPALESLRQTNVALALGTIGSDAPAFVARLIELLGWPYWETRMRAIWAIGRLGSRAPESAIEQLRERVHDPESDSVRRMAERVLEDSAASI